MSFFDFLGSTERSSKPRRAERHLLHELARHVEDQAILSSHGAYDLGPALRVIKDSRSSPPMRLSTNLPQSETPKGFSEALLAPRGLSTR